MKALGFIIAVIVLSVGAMSAHADDGKVKNAQQEKARALNKQAKAKYKLGDFEVAVTLLKQAYESYPEASILFNLGQAYRKLKQYEKAIDVFKAYLVDAPDAEDRTKVEERIKELEQLVAKQKASDGKPPEGMKGGGPDGPQAQLPPARLSPVPADAELRDMAPGPRAWYESWLGWTFSGVGVVGAAAGLGFLVSAGQVDDQVAGTPEGPMRDELRSRATSQRTIGTVALIAGGLFVVAGVTVFILNPQPSRDRRGPARPEVSMRVGPGNVTLIARF